MTDKTPQTLNPSGALATAAAPKTPIPAEVRLPLTIQANDHAHPINMGTIVKYKQSYYLAGPQPGHYLATIEQHDGVHEIHGQGFTATFTIKGNPDFGSRDKLHVGEFVIIDADKSVIIFHPSETTVAEYPPELSARNRESELAHIRSAHAVLT